MFVTLQQDMDPLNNYTNPNSNPLGVDPRGPWSPVAGSFNFLGQKTSMFVTLFIYWY